MHVQRAIEQLGYTPKEAKVYLAALSLGEAHISDIAEKVKMPRTSTQVIMDKLHRDGLVNFYVQRRYKYWVAENPERLLATMEKRERAMREALPSLDAMRKTARKGKRGMPAAQSIGVFQMLADASLQPVLVADEAGRIEYVNAAWEAQFGYALEEIRGESPRLFSSPDTPHEVHESMWRQLRAGKMFQSDALVDKRKDGTVFNLLTTIFPVRHGERLYFIQILDDITARKRVDILRKDFISKARA